MFTHDMLMNHWFCEFVNVEYNKENRKGNSRYVTYTYIVAIIILQLKCNFRPLFVVFEKLYVTDAINNMP